MSIDQIKGNNYTSRTNKSDSSPKANPKSTGSDSTKAASGNTKPTDSLSLSGSVFENEVAFTKKILGNTRQDSLASLKAIKKKINAGAYNNGAVHKKISVLVDEDLSMLQNILSKPIEDAETESTISTEHKNRLLENPQVTQKVADTIAKDLQNL